MSFQPIEEKNAERKLIKKFAKEKKGKVIKLQGDNDDGLTDGIIEFKNGKQVCQVCVEARRKGFPNHKGKICSFKDGWESETLISGIFLNESTIRNYIGIGFIFLVKIKGFKPRYCVIDPSMVDALLRQTSDNVTSTNSRRLQSVKKVPLGWFKE